VGENEPARYRVPALTAQGCAAIHFDSTGFNGTTDAIFRPFSRLGS